MFTIILQIFIRALLHYDGQRLTFFAVGNIIINYGKDTYAGLIRF